MPLGEPTPELLAAPAPLSPDDSRRLLDPAGAPALPLAVGAAPASDEEDGSELLAPRVDVESLRRLLPVGIPELELDVPELLAEVLPPPEVLPEVLPDGRDGRIVTTPAWFGELPEAPRAELPGTGMYAGDPALVEERVEDDPEVELAVDPEAGGFPAAPLATSADAEASAGRLAFASEER